MISGLVIHGDKIGRKYGYPTANLDCPQKNVKIGSGIYAAWAIFDNEKKSAVLVVQDNNKWKVEVHLLDFEGDLYGKHIEVEPIQKVSEHERYDSKDGLIEKIKNDMQLVRNIFESI